MKKKIIHFGKYQHFHNLTKDYILLKIQFNTPIRRGYFPVRNAALEGVQDEST